MKKYIHQKYIYLIILIAFACQKEGLPIDKRWQFVSGKRELSISGISPTTNKDVFFSYYLMSIIFFDSDNDPVVNLIKYIPEE